MMGLAIAVLSVFMFLQLGSGKIPPRPKLSTSFSAESTVFNAGTEQKYISYINYEEQKVLQILDLGPAGAGTGHVQTLVLGKSMMIYNFYDAFNFCAAQSVEVTVLDQWSWLMNATFKGTETFKGMQVDVWTYKNKTEDITYEAGVLSTDPEKPVYLLHNIGLPEVFSSFDNSVPPESMFAIPPACEHAKAFPHKRPSGSNLFMSALFKHA